MNPNSLHYNYLLLVTVFVIFYPTKGLLNLVYYFLQFESYPGFFNKLIFTFLVMSILTLFLIKKFEINRYFFHLIISTLGIGISLGSGDINLINKVLMLFLFPILLSVFDDLSEIYVERIIKSFFKFTLIYMIIEFILLNIRIDGTNLISQENYQTFYSIISPSGKTIDYRHVGSWWTIRSGGFLGDVLAMPVMVLMPTIYFYINYRINQRHLFYALIGIFLVISNISTTAIISLSFTILIFEMHKLSLKIFLIKAFMITSIVTIIVYFHPSSDYVIGRVIENFGDPEYMSVFFDYSFLLEKDIYYAFLFGKWTWLDTGISSHLDIFLIPASMGLIGIYIMYKIFLRGFLFYRGKNNLYTIYSYILFSTFITLYHHAMTLSVNVIILVILISNRVNNSIKPKYRFDIFYFLNQCVVLISKNLNRQEKLR